MKAVILSAAAFASMLVFSSAEVKLDELAFGESLGGWKKRDKQAAEYPLSGATYRTYKPDVSPTPDGGVFISVRIDHVRGWLSSDDHAILEVTVNPIGMIAAAQSNIALQGRSISSDVILGSNEANKELGGTDRAVQIGTDLVADLSAKLLREKIVEAGRVSFPSVLRHNYNLLFQAIRLNGEPVQIGPPPVAKPLDPQEPSAGKEPADTTGDSADFPRTATHHSRDSEGSSDPVPRTVPSRSSHTHLPPAAVCRLRSRGIAPSADVEDGRGGEVGFPVPGS